MYAERLQPVSGHVFSREGKRGTVWYAKWRDVEGQHQKKLGPGWTAKGAPPVGYLRRREAQAELEAILVDSRRGALRRVKVGLLFRDVAAEWLRHGEPGRGWKPTTIKDYRSVVNAHLLPAFGAKRVDAITSRSIERWRSDWLAETGRTRQAAKLVSVLHAIFERTRKTQGLTVNPVATVERYSVPYDRASYDFYSPEQVMALARAAASEQDGALYLVAAFTGLRRGELLALRWRDVDFERQSIRVERNYSHGQVVTPKSGHGRAVPMVPEVAQVLARLDQREHFTGRDDLVFVGEAGSHLDGSALRRRFKTAMELAEIPPLRFHDLRHTFGSLAINKASIIQVQAWMGHADIDTTMRYLHHKDRGDEAALLAGAFTVDAASRAGVPFLA
jgi:integrase